MCADGPTESLEWLAAQAGVHLRLLEGPVHECLLAAVEKPASMPPCSEHGRRRAVAAEQSAAPPSTCSS